VLILLLGWAVVRSDRARRHDGAGQRPGVSVMAGTPSDATVEAPLVPGDATKFDADVTIPDGTVVRPNQEFVKTWEIRNTGSVVWPNRYLRREDSQARSDSCRSVPRAPILRPGSGRAVRISVTLTAPSGPADCLVVWKTVDEQGRYFFPGFAGLWVTVKVAAPDS
jgi:Ig-like domain-containing protein